MDRGVWRAAVHGVAQSDRTEGTEHSTLAGTKRTALGGGALFNLPYRGSDHVQSHVNFNALPRKSHFTFNWSIKSHGHMSLQ